MHNPDTFLFLIVYLLMLSGKHPMFPLVMPRRDARTDAVEKEDDHHWRQAAERGQDCRLHSHHGSGCCKFFHTLVLSQGAKLFFNEPSNYGYARLILVEKLL